MVKRSTGYLRTFENAPQHQGFIVAIVDQNTRYPEMRLTNNITSGRTVKWLRQVFTRFGNQDTI